MILKDYFTIKNIHHIYILGICIIFYTLNYYSPLFWDDWHYNFIFGTFEPINSLGDIIKSQWSHYQLFNGRFTPHFFVQLFDGILGKELFNVVNTFVFYIFLHLMAKVTHGKRLTYGAVSVLTFLLFLFLPGFKYNLLWMSGACNYLWVAVFILIFHILLQKDIKNKKLYPFIFIYGLFCGWTNEAFIVGLACGYFVYYICHIKELTTYRICLLTGLFLGSALLVFSPGSIHRALGDSTTAAFEYEKFLNKLIYSLKAMSNLRIFVIFWGVLIVSVVSKIVNIRKFIYTNQIWLIAMAISFIFLLLTGHEKIHTRFGIEFFSLILTLKLISLYNIPKYCLNISNTLIILLSLYILYFARMNYIDYNRCLRQIEKPNQEIIFSNAVECNSYVERFLLRFPDFINPFVNNENIANHFAKKRLLCLPERIYNEITLKSTSYTSFDLNSPYPFYVKKLSKNQQIKSVTFEVVDENSPTPSDKTQDSSKTILNYGESIFMPATLFSILEINKNNYLFVSKINTNGNRVKNIIINKNQH